jgi:hypothetical protein
MKKAVIGQWVIRIDGYRCEMCIWGDWVKTCQIHVWWMIWVIGVVLWMNFIWLRSIPWRGADGHFFDVGNYESYEWDMIEGDVRHGIGGVLWHIDGVMSGWLMKQMIYGWWHDRDSWSGISDQIECYVINFRRPRYTWCNKGRVHFNNFFCWSILISWNVPGVIDGKRSDPKRWCSVIIDEIGGESWVLNNCCKFERGKLYSGHTNSTCEIVSRIFWSILRLQWVQCGLLACRLKWRKNIVGNAWKRDMVRIAQVYGWSKRR